ncbi:MAG: aldehyde ferredoxin oxidoreductase C-terminal domain-containing protein [Isosphaeraceae bacterium]|nr:aldehyde ferredoxin oxidoreductase C-terminal domain-containing protein [Isosphaeraceae bacterium]
MAGGYHGRAAILDASTGECRLEMLSESELRGFVGGVGLGSRLLLRHRPDRTPPLDPAAVLVFALSPLVGSPLTTSAKFAVVGISPLTGRICDALSSSHFAIAAKRVGVDALVVRGAAAEPSFLLVEGASSSEERPRSRLVSAREWWGATAAEAEAGIRDRFGSDLQVAAIGAAGERLVPFATISHDGRHAGRGGLGAILGSKRIKAIAVRGDRRASLTDPEATIALAKRLSERSFGPATEKYRELGTIANLLVFNRLQALPTRHFATGRFETADRLVDDSLQPALRIARNSCAACTIGCEHVFAVGPDRGGSRGGVRLEYESLFALGPLCGVDDSEFVLRAARACDDFGVDTISTGGTIAFAMECAERGWIDAPWLRFGSGEAVLEAIERLRDPSDGVGGLLAMGSRRMAERLGPHAEAIAVHVKGLELPGYDPRRLPAMALGLAVGTRGADHNRSGAYEADFSNRVDLDDATGRSFARAVIETEDRAALIDSLILCKFLRGVFGDLFAESAEMLRAVTGWDVDGDELHRTAKRIVDLRKHINEREGWTRAEDRLPARVAAEPGTAAAAESTRIDAYYLERGWDLEGRLRSEIAREFDG